MKLLKNSNGKEIHIMNVKTKNFGMVIDYWTSTKNNKKYVTAWTGNGKVNWLLSNTKELTPYGI